MKYEKTQPPRGYTCRTPPPPAGNSPRHFPAYHRRRKVLVSNAPSRDSCNGRYNARNNTLFNTPSDRFVPINLHERNSTRNNTLPDKSTFDRSQFSNNTSVSRDSPETATGKRDMIKHAGRHVHLRQIHPVNHLPTERATIYLVIVHQQLAEQLVPRLYPLQHGWNHLYLVIISFHVT